MEQFSLGELAAPIIAFGDSDKGTADRALVEYFFGGFIRFRSVCVRDQPAFGRMQIGDRFADTAKQFQKTNVCLLCSGGARRTPLLRWEIS